MQMFIKKLKNWATALEWISVCKINEKSLLSYKNDGKIIETRDAQMYQQMLTCIRNSIIDKCSFKLENSGLEPTIKVVNGSHEKTIEDGPLYFKIMISRITINSRSTVACSVWLGQTYDQIWWQCHSIRWLCKGADGCSKVKGKYFQWHHGQFLQVLEGHIGRPVKSTLLRK